MARASVRCRADVGLTAAAGVFEFQRLRTRGTVPQSERDGEEQQVEINRFGHFAQQNPDALAVVDPSGQRWPRGRVAAAANRMSRALRAQGVVSGDVMAIVAPNCAEYLVAYLAATQIGMYVVPVNWHLAQPEIQYILEDSRARVLVAHERFASAINSVLSRMGSKPPIRICFGSIDDFTSLTDFARDHEGAALRDPLQGRVLGYTSATTGKPKGVLLPLADAERMLDLSISTRTAVGMLPEEHVFLCVSMLYHGAPLDAAAVALHMGHSTVLMDRMSPETVLQLIERYEVTYAYIVPSMFGRLLRLRDSGGAKYSISSLRRVVHVGAPCPVDVKRRMIEWWGPILWEVYGATEGSGTIVGSEEWLSRPGTVGRPIPGSRLMIVDEDGNELPPGEIGTIYMTRFAGDRFEYLGDPEKTRASYRGDFFTVGDMGYVDDEGFLFLCDRKIDMINLSGMKVYPAEIESILITHPHVADCAVFGVPDALTGEAIAAVIQPDIGAPPPSELMSSVTRMLREHLSVMKIPRYIETTADLGRAATGKLNKRRLREHYLARGAARGAEGP